ncbi:ATP-binding protein [Fibrobacter sp. UWB10]|uniref:hybrid sensor histidine kinase/response regulator n=1 Tax=Fibrobacter sp. UWB10 TaxID=1896201 RepID=UPI00240329D5|nr:ATP-binding protein [Fibrobacter sp. UWB10]SMP47050.1 Signal transduction histidine kinase [Fibrobacter sp. UWB10]
MKKIKLKRWMPLSPAIVVVAIAVVVLVFVYAVMARESYFKQVEESIAQETKRIASEITSTMNYAKSSVKLVSQSVSKKMDGPELRRSESIFLAMMDEVPFSRIDYIRKDGLKLSYDEEPVDVSESEFFRLGMTGKSGIWIDYKTKAYNESRINVYTPLYYGKNVIGVISGILGGKKDILPMLNYTVGGERTVVLLCDHQLNIIASNIVDNDYGASFEKRAQEFFPPEIFDQFKKNAVIKEPKAFRFSTVYGTSIACVMPTNELGWFVVQMVPYHVLSNATKVIAFKALFALLFVLLFFIIYVHSVYRTNRRLRNEMEGKHLNVINALTDSYGSAFVIDSKTGQSECYCIDQYVSRYMQDAFDKAPLYDQFMSLYVNRMVLLDDRSLFDRVVTLERLNREFLKHNRFEYIYRISRGGVIHYMQIHYVKPSKDRPEIVMGIKVIDESMNAELEKRKELNEQRVALVKALDRAQRADKAKSNFLFNISHDLRTPMNAVLGYSSLAQKYLLNKNFPEAETSLLNYYLGCIQSAGTLLLDMINSVLCLTTIESGYEKLEERPVLTAALSEDLITTFEQSARQKNVMLQVSRNIKTRCVNVDKVKFHQILLNIVSNAIKYTRAGGLVRISMRDFPHENPEMSNIEMVVEDTGVGISEEFLPKVFELFEREQSALTRGIDGTGLGLCIVKKLVDLMHGTVKISSRVGEGTRVVVVIPLRIAEDDADTKMLDFSPFKKVLAGKHILLADDDPQTCEIVSFMLKSVDAEVVCVNSGDDCYRKIDVSPTGSFDVVLMDMKMPKGNGFETTALIRKMADHRKSELPIIALSASAFEEEKQAAFDAGVNGHVAKPIDFTELFALITRLVK